MFIEKKNTFVKTSLQKLKLGAKTLESQGKTQPLGVLILTLPPSKLMLKKP